MNLFNRRRAAAVASVAVIAGGLVVSGFGSPSRAAAIISVDCDRGETIAGALATADAGDTLRVSGTCHESVVVSKPVTLDGQGEATVVGPPASTPLTGPTAFTFFVGASGVTIENFNVQRGGHAIHLSGPATATIQGNTITGSGGAIHLDKQSVAQILGNTITDNAFGVNVQEGSVARIGFAAPTVDPVGNVITHNTGPGITVGQHATAWIVGNTITQNAGTGIRIDRMSQADVASNRIGANQSNGITVLNGSGLNLSGVGTVRPADDGNLAAARNGGFGVACSVGGYVTGSVKGLTGKKGTATFKQACVNAASTAKSKR